MVTTTLANTSLADQLRINNRAIVLRRDMMGLTDEDCEQLALCRNHIKSVVSEVIESYYGEILQWPEIALLIGDSDTLGRLRKSMRGYIMEMFGGVYDIEYVNKRLRIGKVHKRIGVSPKLYTTALRVLWSLLEEEIEKVKGGDAETLSMRRAALQKVIMFDIQLVFDTYISAMLTEVESARQETEKYAESLEGEIASRTRELEEFSRLDGLTGLANRTSFLENLRRELAVAERTQEGLSLVFCDLNKFKAINDTEGHAAGDAMLQKTANLMRRSFRETDIVSRYAGDEFCVIMPRTDGQQAKAVCERMVAGMSEADFGQVSFSIGIRQMDLAEGLAPEDLIHSADRTMYRAKALARTEDGNYIVVATHDDDVEELPGGKRLSVVS
jgi:diguanylate cyclase (GGDEF)-like protein